MAQNDIFAIDNSAGKLFWMSGTFSTTVKTSQTGASGGRGIGYDRVNTFWVGSNDDKLKLTSGQFTSTIKDSENVGGFDSLPSGISWDETNVPWMGETGRTMHLQSGAFTSTLKTSRSTLAWDAAPTDISWDGAWNVNPDTPWCGRAKNKLFLTSGQFTALMKDSVDLSGVESVQVLGISFNGTDTPWNGFNQQKSYLQSGQFTSTIKISLSMSGVVASNHSIDSHLMLGALPIAEITFPALVVSATSGFNNASITFPSLGISARSRAIAECVVMNTKNFAVSEYLAYGFNSMTKFNGANLIADQNGIYEQDSSDLDDSAYKIKAHIKSGRIDLYADVIQRLRNAWLSYQTDGDVEIVTRADKKITRTYNLPFHNGLVGINERRVKFQRGIRNRIFDFKVANINGSQMEIDKLTITLEPISSKRR